MVKTLNTVSAPVMVDLGALAGGDNHVCASGNKPAATGEVTRILRDWFGWRHVLDLGDITTARTVDVPGAVVRMLAAVGRRPSTSRSRPDRGGSPGGIPALARRLWPVLAVVLTETAWPRLSCAPGHLVVNTASDGAGRPCVAGYHPYIGGTAFKPGQLTGHTATASGRAKRCSAARVPAVRAAARTASLARLVSCDGVACLVFLEPALLVGELGCDVQ